MCCTDDAGNVEDVDELAAAENGAAVCATFLILDLWRRGDEDDGLATVTQTRSDVEGLDASGREDGVGSSNRISALQ